MVWKYTYLQSLETLDTLDTLDSQDTLDTLNTLEYVDTLDILDTHIFTIYLNMFKFWSINHFLRVLISRILKS